jgi:uncharacterized LabA/DUF88 family protein
MTDIHIKHKEQRVGIFIDAQNLYHSAKNLYQSRVNFGQVVKDVLADRVLIRAMAYVITTESGDERNFFEALQKMGIEVRTKDLQIFMGGAKKADWDVGMAVDAIKLAPKLDTVILITGDGDFIPLIEYLKINQGCRVEVASFGQSSSLRLKEAADEFLDLSDNARRYLINTNNPQRPTRHDRAEPRFKNRRGRSAPTGQAHGKGDAPAPQA